MKKVLIHSATTLLLVLVLIQCKPNTEKNEAVKAEKTVIENTNSHQITIKEIQQANAYTYLLETESKKRLLDRYS
jgi:hypothetical protein